MSARPFIGITIAKAIGIGDVVQFTSIPENYFKHTGDKLADLDHNWVFDFNPYVLRNVQKVDEVFNLWDLHCFDVPKQVDGKTTFLSNAHAHSRHFKYPVVLNRPRLYKFEEYPYQDRHHVFLHVKGRSHGFLPEHVVKHVLDKYGNLVVFIGLQEDWIYSMPIPARSIYPKTLWDLAAILSKARMFIGVDSGPSWIAQCYPDVITKKVRMFPSVDALKDWMPLEWCRLGSHWDDRSAMIFNPSEQDAGFTWSYLKI